MALRGSQSYVAIWMVNSSEQVSFVRVAVVRTVATQS